MTIVIVKAIRLSYDIVRHMIYCLAMRIFLFLDIADLDNQGNIIKEEMSTQIFSIITSRFQSCIELRILYILDYNYAFSCHHIFELRDLKNFMQKF